MASPIVLEGEWLTLSQTAARLGVTTQYISRLVKAGRIVYQDTPLGRLFSGEAVDAFKAEREAQPDAPDPAAATVSVLDSSD